MIAIAVDDEALMLRALVRAISVSPDIKGVFKFTDCEMALPSFSRRSVLTCAGLR